MSQSMQETKIREEKWNCENCRLIVYIYTHKNSIFINYSFDHVSCIYMYLYSSFLLSIEGLAIVAV